MNSNPDVIIVGARVAGASLAILLGRMGKKVLLLDKAAFPSDTLSTHHLSHLEYVKKLDVLEEVEASGLRKINRMRTYIGDSFIEGPRASYTLIPRRDQFDHVLVKKALSYPTVDLKEGYIVNDILKAHDRVQGVKAQDKKGNVHEFKASLVVGADGKNSFIAQEAGAKKYNEQSPVRPVFYGYYHNVQPIVEPTTEIFLNKGRIGFLFPMEPGVDCLGLEVLPYEFSEIAKNPERFEEIYRQFYGMESRLAQASLQGRIIGTTGMPNFYREAGGNGWALVGDAAHSKDPSTGLGMNDALMQSFLLAEAIEAWDNGGSWRELIKRFQKQRDENLGPGYRLTLDYIQSRRALTSQEESLFQAMAANPMVWNKVVPHLPQLLKQQSQHMPELYGSVEHEAKSFGFEY
ncbi:FAD-dependent oxidoreductase [Halobacillus andaensis]|uniref:FAD-dependent oxidoreductase n=1 Tax=Halobacillus andaensis TaxID=1176239 RepID=A0A917B5U0_HALAA|nr:NAD(P)/FAD-dependent oxidoreductase [Halobacillus andaensis]MBP2004535.1 2-polyprenyl-6-methoxyphenol hydroxylase-like FAD-dependent oxidoreductase [Halobacillus andaensis]GGF20919.1 FAD-dependent oxidoreductase [Halobacillus andaensis]